jgi:hypothetical protein
LPAVILHCEESPNLSSVLTEGQVDVRSGTDVSSASKQIAVLGSDRESETAVELGIWLSGIESFLVSGHHSFADPGASRILPDASREFRLVHSTLQRSLLMTSRLLSEPEWMNAGDAVKRGLGANEMNEFTSAVRDVTLLSEALINSNSLGAAAWKSWARVLSNTLGSLSAFTGLIGFAEDAGEKFLPGVLGKMTDSDDPLNAEHAELALVLPRFAKILRWLNVVGRMLETDEPLKPALLIFARVNEQIFELTTYINNRLERFPNEEAVLFASLDAASYTASIELKKVYSQELAGVARLRPSPSIYARMETSYALLTEGFQQILAGFAQLVDPSANVFNLFPNFAIKLDQSLALRKELWQVAQIVQSAEQNPGKKEIETLQKSLRDMMRGTARYLFYKDTETVERFVEEILITKQNKDLVPILHRFGAYLDTLVGQVSLRAVLANHPFDPSKI